MKVQPIYNSKILKKGLEFAAENSSLFIATTALGLQLVARPLAIMVTPKTDRENKKYACAKSLASSVVGYGLMLSASLPLARAIKNIDENPQHYLKLTTIKSLQAGEKTLQKSKQYALASQLFKLGLGFLIAVPKSILTCALIPKIMSIFFKDKNEQKEVVSNISFKGKPNFDTLSKGIGKIIDTEPIKKFAKKFHDTNFELHLISLTDVFATGAFITQTANSKKIKQERKKALMWNAGISTGLCIGGGYVLNKILEKPTQNFIRKFKEANKNSPKLDKYLEGIRIAKPAIILGGIYYIVIPMISTFLADRTDRKLIKE